MGSVEGVDGIHVTRTRNPDCPVGVCTQVSLDAPPCLDQPCLGPDSLSSCYRNCLVDITEVQGFTSLAPGWGHLWGISHFLPFSSFKWTELIPSFSCRRQSRASSPHSSDSPPARTSRTSRRPASALTENHSLPVKVNSYLLGTQSALLSLNPVPQLRFTSQSTSWCVSTAPWVWWTRLAQTSCPLSCASWWSQRCSLKGRKQDMHWGFNWVGNTVFLQCVCWAFCLKISTFSWFSR